MAWSEFLAIELLLAAFAGGAFGAAIGALPSFSLAGLMVIIGETYDLTTLNDPHAIDITGTIAFGPVLGPHIAFGGGAAATAYAAKQNYLDTDFAYHEAKHITRGLGTRPDVVIVGGGFGILGYWIATLVTTIAAPIDPVATGVVGSAILHRLVFGYSLIGAPLSTVFDMTPYAAGDTALEPWLPYQYKWVNVTILGLAVGAISAYTAYITASPFLAFGITVTALAMLCAGVPHIPVTHHMALPASTSVLALTTATTPTTLTTTVPLWEAMLAGTAFGIIGALLGEASQRLFYAHADTHLDPPAASIVLTSLLIAGLAMMDVLESSVWIPHP